MIGHMIGSFAQLLRPSFLWLVIKAFVTTALIFAGLYALGVWSGLTFLEGRFTEGWLNTAGDIVYSLMLFGLFVLLYLPVSAIVVGMFVEKAASLVEKRVYPASQGQREHGTFEGIKAGLSFAGGLILANFLALPVYIFLPGINIAVFLILNGYLAGREYFEMVSLRHVPSDQMKTLRGRFRLRIFFAGVLIALIFVIPVINFVAPLIAAAFMVHVFQDIGREAALFSRPT